MTANLSARAVVILGFVLVATLGPATPAFADRLATPAGATVTEMAVPIDDPTTGPSRLISTTCAVLPDGESTDQLLPVNRWADSASSVHSRLDADIWNDLAEKVQRNGLFWMMLSGGNGLWQMATGLTNFATRFCMLDTLGFYADNAAATLGNVLFDNGIIAAIAGVAALVLLWRQARRGENPMKRVGRSILVLTLLGVMLHGATLTTGGAYNSGNLVPTRFGVGSPGWFAVKINTVISTLATGPAAALSNLGTGVDATTANAASESDPLDCAWYVKALHDKYTEALSSANLSQSSLAYIPLTMSAMWENSGMAAWAGVQYGTANTYGERVGCRQLEITAREFTSQQMVEYASSAPGFAAADPAAAPWTDAWNDKLLDTTMVAWAACRYSGGAWTVDPAWASVDNIDNGGPITADLCQQWWTTGGDGVAAGALAAGNMADSETPFNFEDDAAYIQQVAGETTQAPVRNFLLNWHGNDNGAAFTLALTFLVAALVMLVIFGGLAVATVIAKVLGWLMLIVVIVVLVTSLWPSDREARIVKATKFYVGLNIFVLGLSVLFGLIAFVSGMISKVAAGTFGAGSILSVIGIGFAPVAAVVALHMTFNHALKLPSPFKVSGAMAWGGAIAGMGAAVGVGLDRTLGAHGRLGRMVGGGVRNQIGNRGLRRALAGEPVSRFGNMKQNLRNTPTTGTAGAQATSAGAPSTQTSSTATAPSTMAPLGTRVRSAADRAFAEATVNGRTFTGQAIRNTASAAAAGTAAAARRRAEAVSDSVYRARRRAAEAGRFFAQNPIRKAAIGTAAVLSLPVAAPVTLGALAAIHVARRGNRAEYARQGRQVDAKVEERRAQRRQEALDATRRTATRRKASTPQPAGAVTAPRHGAKYVYPGRPLVAAAAVQPESGRSKFVFPGRPPAAGTDVSPEGDDPLPHPDDDQ